MFGQPAERPGGYLGWVLRKRKRPRVCTGSRRVRERLEAVEIPLKRTKKSQKASKWSRRKRGPMGEERGRTESISQCIGDQRAAAGCIFCWRGGVAGYLGCCFFDAGLGAGFLFGLEMPMLMRKKRKPLRSASSMMTFLLRRGYFAAAARGGAGEGAGARSRSSAAGGRGLSALASSRATCHISVSVSCFL